MIPHTLQIKNFLSYGSDIQTIDFRPYNLMYLSGKNGHGKSALLDAMTWAIWGCARKTTNAVKPDQGLLRLGTTHMMVIFDFQVNGQLYRIKREFIQATAKQLAYLEFGMIKDDGTIIPLTDKTIRATQEVIERTIRLDYESFVNSAFLRQGHANEFSKKSPKDRKEILGTILGLQQFEQLKKRALERVKQATDQRNTIHAILETLAQQLPDAQNLASEVQQLNAQIRDVQQQDMQLQEQQKNFDVAFATHSMQQKEWEILQFKYEQIKQSYQQQLHAMMTLWKQWRTVHAQQLKFPDYAALEKQKKILFERLQSFQQLLQQRLSLQEQMMQSKEALQHRQREVEAKNAQELQNIEVAITRLHLEKQMLEQQYTTAINTQKEYVAQEQVQSSTLENLTKSLTAIDLAAATAQFEKRKNFYQQYIAKVNWLKTEHENITHKTAVTQSNDPSCPLCEQNLSAARRKFLAQRFARQEIFITHQRTRLQTVIARLKQLLLDQHQQLTVAKEMQSKKDTLINEQTTLQNKNKELQHQLTTLHKTVSAITQQMHEQETKLKIQREKTAAAIMLDAAYAAAQKTINDIQKKLAECAINESEYKQVQHNYDLITKQLDNYIAINHEIIKQAQRYEDIQHAVIALQCQKKELDNQQYTAQADALKQAGIRFEQWQKEIHVTAKALQATKEKLREEHGRLKTKQEQTERIVKEQRKQQDMLQKLTKEIEDYHIIAAAAGKDGIQALLIEEAIPEIEQEANYLLSKLTNNQAHILIESLRDLKSGGSKETLDINISDPSGIRPYEMFSGGEAFRIDFALRIAISKLLARRAGTSLQTLIIDEGFGSQDEEGLSLIMDAMYKVQADFEKVIVVSHLPSMRDQFPVHFVVEKGPNGSKISVIEQG